MTRKEPNYKVFIPVGVTFMGAGAALTAAVNPGVGVALMALGVIFFIIGIKKKKEEEENK